MYKPRRLLGESREIQWEKGKERVAGPEGHREAAEIFRKELRGNRVTKYRSSTQAGTSI